MKRPSNRFKLLPRSMVSPVQSPPIGHLPANWEDCSRTELEWLAEHGNYGQRMIARRYLK